MLSIGSKMQRAFIEGDDEWGSVACGQICGMINDTPTCKDLIEDIVAGAMKMANKIARDYFECGMHV